MISAKEAVMTQTGLNMGEMDPMSRKRIANVPFGLWMLLCAFAFFVPAQSVLAQSEAETNNALTAVDVSSLPGSRVQIRFSMSQPAAEPLSFTIDTPARVALDFADTRSELPQRTTQLGVGVARSVTAVEARGRTRVVLNLVQMVPYETRVEGNQVYVILGARESTDVSPTAPIDKAPTVFSTRDVSTSHAIEKIDFRRGDDGEGRIHVTLSDSAINVNVREQGGKVAIDFADANLPPELEQRLDVVDFATPVTMIDTFRQGGSVRMVVSAKGDYEHLVYQSDKLLTIEVKQKVELDKEALARLGDERAFTGERLSLNFQNIEVRAVLQLIADFTGMNLVTSDTVSGGVTLRLQNVPWDQALDIILKTRGLGMRQMGNVMYIAPSAEITAREQDELQSQRQLEKLEPLFSDYIQVNYAEASDIAALLNSKDASLLSERGTVTIDGRTNTLLVSDTANKLADIRKMLLKLDVPVRQVLIESRIVIANNSFGRDLGARFGINRVTPGSDGDRGAYSGSVFSSQASAVGGSLPRTLNVDLPAAGSAGSFGLSLAKLPLGVELSAMQAEGKGEVVSTPRVITTDGKAAFVEQGVEIAYQEASSSGATAVNFKKAVLKLDVTPRITPDDRVVMELSISKDSVGDIYLGTPSINTREIKTEVLVENGETIVLGGVYEQSKNESVQKVPFFGDLPLVGALFRTSARDDTKEELLIFVTPKIVKEGASIE